jgi:ABC-type cobalt transport system, permease component CbiQ and related transporters
VQASRFTETSGSGLLESLDTRAKVAVSVLASIATVILGSVEAQGLLFVCSAGYALCMRRYRIICIAYAVVAVMLLLAFGCATLVRMAAPVMRPVTIFSMLVPFLRLAVMVNVLLPLAFSTRLQTLLSSLKGLKLPFCLYIPMSVMIRYIPTVVADIKLIAEALRIRGQALSPRQFILHPFVSMRVVVMPLLFRSLKTSEDLGIAAELKGLGAERSMRPYRTPVWRLRDTVLLGLAMAVVAAAFACNVYFAAGVQRMH